MDAPDVVGFISEVSLPETFFPESKTFSGFVAVTERGVSVWGTLQVHVP